MNSVLKNKRFLLVAGLAIGLVTLFSHSLRVEIGKGKKQTSEQASEPSHQTVIVAPSDAVTVNFFSLHPDGFLELAVALPSVKKVSTVVPSLQKATIPYFKTLFRFIISPNAP